MASSYTTNSGIEKPAEGDQTGEWGDTVNTNMDIIDRSINGVGAITLSGTTHTLTTTDGTLSDGMYKVLVLGGSPSGTNTITIAPNDADKVYIVVNSSGQTATFTQGSGANVSVLNGDSKIIYADGAGSGAAIVDVTADLSFSSVNIDGGTIDGTVIGGASAAAGTFTTVTASGEIDGASLDISGNADIDGTLETDALSIASTTVTSTAAELNLVDGSSAGSIVNSKAVIYSSAGVVNATDMTVSGSGARSITITSSDSIASMEIGSAASNAAFIDLKTPSSDDFDMRISSESGGSGGFLQVASGNLTLTGSGKTSAVFDGDGAVSLYHNNSVKIATASGGITVTGEVAATSLDISGDVDVDGTLEADAMTLNGTAITTTATLSTGISNTNVPVFTSGVADDDFLRVAGTSIEGRSAAEVLSDIGASAVAGSGSIVTTGALNSGSITSGFGTINNGSSAITTTGLISGGSLDIDDVVINGSTIGHTDDTDLITVANGVATVAGEVSMTTLDIGGTNVTSTAAELNYLDITTLGTTQASKAVTTDSNGDVVFPDGDKINFGTGSDLVLQHDSANSYIQNNTGSLNIQGKSGENGIVLVPDGAVTLYHDNAAKLATTATGVDVTGAATASTFEPDSDTAAGDNAAIGYTSAEGLILTGQGSTSDVTIKNDADATVINIPTGTTKVGIGHAAAASTLDVLLAGDGNISGPTSGVWAARVVNEQDSDTYNGLAVQNRWAADSAFILEGAMGWNGSSAGYFPVFTIDGLGQAIFKPQRSEAMRITSAGRVGIGTTAAATKLHIIDSLSGGQLLVATSESDNAEKYGTFGTQHYDTDQEPVLAISAQSAASENNVLIGGALGEFNAATSVKFFTAANATTTTGSERMRITSDGKVGVGTAGNLTGYVNLPESDYGEGFNWFSSGTAANRGGIGHYAYESRIYYGASDNLTFVDGGPSGTERMRIDASGRITIGTSSFNSGLGHNFHPDGYYYLRRASGAAQTMMIFYNDGNAVGEIRTSTTATQYLTSSDYRLKENVDYSWDATARLKQLKPARFNFISDPDVTVDGFIAHEAQEVVPHAVTGKKDAEEMQAIDQSKLVPLLTASLQEALKRIDSLEEQVNALKGK